MNAPSELSGRQRRLLIFLIVFSCCMWLATLNHYHVSVGVGMLLTLTPALPAIWLEICKQTNMPKEPMPKIGDRWND